MLREHRGGQRRQLRSVSPPVPGGRGDEPTATGRGRRDQRCGDPRPRAGSDAPPAPACRRCHDRRTGSHRRERGPVPGSGSATAASNPSSATTSANHSPSSAATTKPSRPTDAPCAKHNNETGPTNKPAPTPGSPPRCATPHPDQADAIRATAISQFAAVGLDPGTAHTPSAIRYGWTTRIELIVEQRHGAWVTPGAVRCDLVRQDSVCAAPSVLKLLSAGWMPRSVNWPVSASNTSSSTLPFTTWSLLMALVNAPSTWTT
jgi:hypothetical protein